MKLNRRSFTWFLALIGAQRALPLKASATTDSGLGSARVPSQKECEAFVDRIISWKPGESKDGIAVVASDPSSLIGILQRIPELNVSESVWLGATNPEEFLSSSESGMSQQGEVAAEVKWYQDPAGAAFTDAICRSRGVRIAGATGDGYSIGISESSAAYGLFGRPSGDYVLVVEQDDVSAKSGSGPYHDPYQSKQFQRALVQFLGYVVNRFGENMLVTADGYRGPEIQRPMYEAGELLQAAMTYYDRQHDALPQMVT